MPRSFDFRLTTVGGTTRFFNCAAGPDGNKLFRQSLSQKFSPSLNTFADISYGTVPPEQERTHAHTSWHRGLGFYESSPDNPTEDLDRYGIAYAVDLSVPRAAILGPAMTALTLGGGLTVMNSTMGQQARASFLNRIYFGMGTELWYVPANSSTATRVGTFAATIQSLTVHANRLYVALGSATAYQYSAAGVAGVIGDFTASNRAGADANANLFAVSRQTSTAVDTLWKVVDPTALQYTSDGTNGAAAWSTSIAIGSTGENFTFLAPFQTGMIVTQNSRASWYDSINGRVIPVAGPYRTGTLTNFAAGVVTPDGQRAYFRVEDKKLIEVSYNGTVFSIARREPWLFGPRFSDLNNTIVGVDADTTWVYVALGSTKGYVFKGGYGELLYPRDAGAAGWLWHGSITNTNLALNGLFLAQDTTNGVTYLYAGRNTSPFTPYRGGVFIDPLTDTNATFTATGNFIDHYVNDGVRSILKRFRYNRIESEQVTLNETIDIEYQLDASTSWTFLGTYSANPAVAADSLYYPANTTWKRMRHRITLGRGSTTTNTPILESLLDTFFLQPERRFLWDITVLIEQSAILGRGQAEMNQTPDQLVNFFFALTTGVARTSESLTLYEDLYAPSEFAAGVGYQVTIEDAQRVFVRTNKVGVYAAAIHLILLETPTSSASAAQPSTGVAHSHFYQSRTGSVAAAWTLTQAPLLGLEQIYLNGQLLTSGAGNDYTIAGAVVTLATAPLSTDILIADYPG